MAIRVVLSDANELIPRTPRDYLVFLAVSGAIDLRWSPGIWAEVSRNLRAKFGFSSADIQVLENRLEVALPHSEVQPAPDDNYLAALSGADEKDEHVVAAALAVRADVLLTENISDFPREWLKDRKIELLNLGELLIRVGTTQPREFIWAHRQVIANSRKPEVEILSTLEQTVGADIIRTISSILNGSTGVRF